MGTIRLFKHYIRVPYLLLGLVELLVFVASVYIGAQLRFLDSAVPTAEIDVYIGPLFPRALLFSVVMFVSMLSMGLYTNDYLQNGLTGLLLRVGVSYVLSVILLVLFFYALPALYLGRGVLFLAIVVSFFLIAIDRFLFLNIVDKRLLKRRILIYGAGARASNVTQLMKTLSDRRAFDIIGFVRAPKDRDIEDLHPVHNINKGLSEFVKRHDIDEIVIAMDDRRGHLPIDELLECKMSGVDVVDLPSFFERETGKVTLELLTPSWMIFSDGFDQSSLRLYVERMFDIAASLVLLFLSWPIILITAIAILVESGWGAPILYRQVRVGQGGKPFKALKFRSMKIDAERDGIPQWAEKNDNRITRVGTVIRNLRIDELPQIINVLRGDMGFVGPRPERPEFVHELGKKIPYYMERHRVKPGITGWAQLRYPYGASEKDAMEKLQYDLYYAKNHTLLFDVAILIQTAEVVLFGKGVR